MSIAHLVRIEKLNLAGIPNLKHKTCNKVILRNRFGVERAMLVYRKADSPVNQPGACEICSTITRSNGAKMREHVN